MVKLTRLLNQRLVAMTETTDPDRNTTTTALEEDADDGDTVRELPTYVQQARTLFPATGFCGFI